MRKLDRGLRSRYTGSVMLNKDIRLGLKDLATGKIKELRINEDLDLRPAIEVNRYEPAHVTGKAKAVGDKSLIEVIIKQTLYLDCHRCLEQTCYTFDLTRELVLEDGEIDAFDFCRWIEEELILATPLRIICDEDCKGLCPQCGINLNQKSCDCQPRQKNSPFDVLDSLFD